METDDHSTHIPKIHVVLEGDACTEEPSEELESQVGRKKGGQAKLGNQWMNFFEGQSVKASEEVLPQRCFAQRANRMSIPGRGNSHCKIPEYIWRTFCV